MLLNYFSADIILSFTARAAGDCLPVLLNRCICILVIVDIF